MDEKNSNTQAENGSGTSEANKHSEMLRAVVVDWLNLYAQVYREEITEELIVAYELVLQEVSPQILHKGFLRSMKISKFRPTPAEVLESAGIEAEEAQKLKKNLAPRLPEPEITPAEREEYANDCRAFLDKMGAIKRDKRPPKANGVLVIADPNRIKELERQKQIIMEKYGKKHD